MLRALLRFGFEGPLYPVSSRGGELMGLKVYPSIAALPEAVDLAFLFVPTEALIPVVRQCKEKGVRGHRGLHRWLQRDRDPGGPGAGTGAQEGVRRQLSAWSGPTAWASTAPEAA